MCGYTNWQLSAAAAAAGKHTCHHTLALSTCSMVKYELLLIIVSIVFITEGRKDANEQFLSGVLC